MFQRIDLHCHSLHSDGNLSAITVAERAHARGVTLFCLTDHDSCDGFAATKNVFPHAVRGVELSCTHKNRSVHLLLYERPESRWQVILDALHQQQTVRRERVHLIAERLKKVGCTFDPDAVLASSSGTVGRPHIAAELVRIGAVKNMAEAFDRYLRDGGPGDVQVSRLGIEEGLALGNEANACMSLAHPHVYGKGAEALVRECLPFGLSGLEVFYGPYTAKERKRWHELAQTFQLVETGGSDFHGDNLGPSPRPGIDMPTDRVKRLCDWLEVPSVL